MSHYLLSTYTVDDQVPGAATSPDEMKTLMGRLVALEADMESSGTFVFGGGLHGVASAKVVGSDGGNVVTTDGPFVEAKEHIAGFYVIEAEDFDTALSWAGRVAEATNHPIEVRQFRATGKVADQMGGLGDA